MSLDRMDALETRIRDLVKLVQELKRKNGLLEEELKAARQQLAQQDDVNRRWEVERTDIKTRIEKVMSEIELLECIEDPRRWPLTKTIDVEIYGHRYAITGDSDDAYVRRLAHFVDDHMKHLAEE